MNELAGTKSGNRQSDEGLLADARVVFGGLWLISLALQFYAAPDWLADTVRVVEPPADCVLAEGAGWSSPLSLLADKAFAEWPFPVFALLVAAFLAAVGLRLASFTPAWLVAAFVTGSSLSIEPRHLLPAVGVSAMAVLVRMKLEAKQPEVALRVLLVVVTIAALVTIEFGFVVLVACCLLPGIVGAISDRRRALLESGGVLGIGLIVLLATGSLGDFGAALLRPVSCLWIPTQAVGMTSTGFALSGDSLTLPRSLLAIFLAGVWVSQFRRDRASTQGGNWLPLFAASLIGLCCGRFFWLGACAVSVFEQRNSAREAPKWSLQFLATTVLIVVTAEGSALLNSAWLNAETGLSEWDSPLCPAASTELVDPAAWEVSGNVLLMDLDQSASWQPDKMRGKFRLLIDDRWDIFGDRYLEYAAICRDLFEVRPQSYLRVDGDSGGYLTWQKEWSPALLVTDSRRVERVRQLSLSPHWTVLSVDGERVILGRQHDAQIRPQRQRAASVLLGLEWPIRPLDLIESVLAAGDDEDLRRVAGVLCAMRLPYAALRTLPADRAWTTEKVRTWCYLELAHRTRRHSGTVSLLDQFRALALVRRIHSAGKWTPAELLRIARSLMGLQQFELASELAADFESGGTARSSASVGQRNEARAIREQIRQLEEDEKAVRPTESSGSEFEDRIRRAMAAGRPAGQESLAQVGPELSEVFSVLNSAMETSAAELTSELRRVSGWENLPTPGGAASETPDPRRSELFFLLGCAALESGQSRISSSAFRESLRLDPLSPFRNIRAMHLQRLLD
jgi:hypothetical protein